MNLEKRMRRLEMQNKILASKLYQVCLSHDHLSVSLNRAGAPMTVTDQVMMETTKRVMTAKTPEEIETIYSESSKRLWKGVKDDSENTEPSQEKDNVIKKVWFFKNDLTAKDLISHIEKMMQEIDEHVKELSKEDQALYEEEKQFGDADDEDGDTMKPPF